MELVEIIIIAVVAGAVILRYRSILGRRTGHERPTSREGGFASGRRFDPGKKENVVKLPNQPAAASDETDPEVNDTSTEVSTEPASVLDAALAQIQRADANFDPNEFREGTQAAFEIIINSYATGDKETLHSLLAKDVYENFAAAIAERAEKDETLETTLIGVRNCEIIDAETDGRNAVLTVKILSEQINVTRDSEDRVIAGDPSQISKVTDIWTFSRNTKSRNPNWTLIGTEASN